MNDTPLKVFLSYLTGRQPGADPGFEVRGGANGLKKRGGVGWGGWGVGGGGWGVGGGGGGGVGGGGGGGWGGGGGGELGVLVFYKYIYILRYSINISNMLFIK